MIAVKLQSMMELAKPRLSSLVVFSAVMSYLFESAPHDWTSILLLSLAGMLVTSSANAINQIIECDSDKLMSRTQNRPLPTGRLNNLEATLFSGLTAVAGIGLLAYHFNPLTGLLGALSLISYGFIYTPFKRVSPAAVFVGAIPGAMPLLIGSSAASGHVTPSGMLLFVIQFLWQMPHFWSIAWLLNEDYKKGGFSLLPGDQSKSRDTAMQSLPYLIALILVSLTAYFLGYVGQYALLVGLIAGSYYLYAGIQMAIDLTDKSARKLMFASFLYIPLVMITFVLDKV